MTISARLFCTLLLLVLLWGGMQLTVAADLKSTIGSGWAVSLLDLLIVPMPAYADFDSDAPAANLRTLGSAVTDPDQPTLVLLLNTTVYKRQLPLFLRRFAQSMGLVGKLYLDLNRLSSLLFLSLLVMIGGFLLLRRRRQDSRLKLHVS